MRLITRNDTSLAISLIVGAIVVFQAPLHMFRDVARDIEVRYNIDLLPGLTIIAGVFIFHQYRKRQLAKAEVAAFAADAARARTRAEELERLVALGSGLANARDLPTLQQTLWQYLPALTGDHDCWVVCRTGHLWQTLMQDGSRGGIRPPDALEAMADRAVAGEATSTGSLEGRGDGGTLCFPMFAGGVPVGVLAVPDGETLPSAERRAIGAAVTLMAMALNNVRMFGETREHSERDGLTGCFNREYALTALDRELRRARRSGEPLSVLMFDVDRFKSINDELGHLQGDTILRALGAQLTRALRTTDIPCRYGGDEFLVILPVTRLPGAEQVADTLRREIGTLTVASGERSLSVTISVGVTAAGPGETDVAALVARADQALYRAKRAGRDRAVVILPASAVPSQPAARPAEPSAGRPGDDKPGAGTETILVVDDEPLLRDQILRVLGQRGYTLLSARNAADAIAIASSHAGPIDLLLTDIILPGVQGPDLARQLRGDRPEIAVLFMSGFVGQPTASATSPHEGSAFMAKPFTSDGLAMKVREQLDLNRHRNGRGQGATQTPR